MLFGVCTLIMDVFKTGYYSSFFECQSAIKILHPLAQAVFVIVQVGVKRILDGKEPAGSHSMHPEQSKKVGG